MNLSEKIDGILNQKGVIELDSVSIELITASLESLITSEKKAAVEEATMIIVETILSDANVVLKDDADGPAMAQRLHSKLFPS